MVNRQADPVTDKQRASAARIRIAVDKKLHRKTEPWIYALANQKPPTRLQQIINWFTN